ncbi:class I SAM-dependent methyltransferase [Phenylobacterium sp.]|uniref:class I SAM-dependent methyltransferase n=1 Tax=Phenylobacterium sp. TaxID=1871053 RepID=UPI002C3348FB|nr:class I SAM-dependent methyltransferase [Phenylobacterium sp.]HLZ75556.1 class I SAM-dependent methyltransferase [Phenylobacterium sp.]
MPGSSACILDANHAPPRYLFNFRQYEVSHCGDCGLIMTGSGFEEGQYEEQDYYTMRHSSPAEIYQEWGFRWRWILRRIQSLRASGSSLDVGAGNGLFVKIAADEFGWKSRGVELSEKEVAFAKRMLDVDIEQKSLNEIPEQFDMVTAFSVLEHVVDPIGLIREMRDHVKDGGLLVLATPSPTCIQARVKGLEKWGMISPPHHINIFSRKALYGLLAKSGFEVVRYDTISTYIQFLRRFERDGTTLRWMVFQALRLLGLGADHLVIARKV